MFNHASRQLLPEHTWNPRCAQSFSWTHACSVRRQGNCCASTREIPATCISIRTQCTLRCSCDNIAAPARHKHTWIALCAQRDRFRRKATTLLHSHAVSTLGSPCAKRLVPAKRLLRSHAASTLGSRSVRRETCSIEKIAAFSRREHTWISLRAQSRRHVHATDCCIRTL